jgi:hypothetical protein
MTVYLYVPAALPPGNEPSREGPLKISKFSFFRKSKAVHIVIRYCYKLNKFVQLSNTTAVVMQMYIQVEQLRFTNQLVVLDGYTNRFNLISNTTGCKTSKLAVQFLHTMHLQCNVQTSRLLFKFYA